jgi:hypothetical protein
MRQIPFPFLGVATGFKVGRREPFSFFLVARTRSRVAIVAMCSFSIFLWSLSAIAWILWAFCSDLFARAATGL